MALPNSLLTFQDAIEHLIGYAGGAIQDGHQQKVRRSVANALAELTQVWDWRYLYRHGRTVLNAPYSTGTIAYDHTGGASERLVTLTTGTWPSWAASGRLLVDGVVYEVDQRLGDSTITLSETHNPGADITAGETYSLYQSEYLLPEDWLSMTTVHGRGETYIGHYVPPTEWMPLERSVVNSGEPWAWTILGSRKIPSRMAIVLMGYPSVATEFDYIYKRKARTLIHSGQGTNDRVGSVAISGTAVTGTSTAFTSSMVGAVLRVTTNTTLHPSGLYSESPITVPFSAQSRILSVGSATACVIEDSIGTFGGGSKYVITDYVDIPPILQDAFYRGMERQLELMRFGGGRGLRETEALYQQAINLACEREQPQLGIDEWSDIPWTFARYIQNASVTG